MHQGSLSYLNQIKLILKSLILSRQVIQQSQQVFYRIIKLPDDTDKRIHFQMIGKNITLKMSPEDIMRDDILLLFSKADIILITHLGTKNEIVPVSQNKFFKILRQIFNKGKTYFLVEKSTGEVSEYQAQDMYNDKSLANNFCGMDGIKIGYTVAEDHYKKISSLKQSKDS